MKPSRVTSPPAARLPLAAALLLALAGCSGGQGLARAHPAAAPSRPGPAPLSGPAWALVAPRGLPLPIQDIGALSNGEAVVLAHGGMYRWDGHTPPVPVCDVGESPPAMIEAEGVRFVALGGEEGAPVAWVSDDRGASCEQVALPPLLVARSLPGRLGLSLADATALAWSTGGAIARSDDGGRTWHRLPDLQGVLRVDTAPHGGALAAAGIEPGSFEPDGPRVRLYHWAPGALRWSPVAGAAERRMPLVFQTLADETVAVADGLGTVSLAADGTVRSSTLEPAYRDPMDVPVVLQRVRGERFVGFTRHLLLVVDRGVARPLAALPGLREPHMIDAADDGWLWAGDPQSLWRTRGDGPLEELTRRPFGEGEPVAMAARGDDLAVVSDRAWLTRSRDGGGHWDRTALPGSLGRPSAVALQPDGAVLVLGPGGLAVSEGGRFVLAELPRRAGAVASTATVTVMGDRWTVTDGDVLTSDDQGARWVHRLGPTVGPTVDSGATARVLSVVFEGAAGYALDADMALWRTDDGAESFHRVDESTAPIHGRTSLPDVLAWDGGRTLALVGTAGYLLSRDGGAHFELAGPPLGSRLATFLPGGALVVLAEPSPAVARACRTAEPAATLAIAAPEGWLVPQTSCQHQGKVFARDGDRLYVLDALGTLWRSSLDAVVREAR